jgi:ubiquinol-cytochrome c reductase cytochrome c1 subunit
MVYLAEPAKMVRYKIGFWVMVFMGIFTLLAYALKREYWRDVH